MTKHEQTLSLKKTRISCFSFGAPINRSPAGNDATRDHMGAEGEGARGCQSKFNWAICP